MGMMENTKKHADIEVFTTVNCMSCEKTIQWLRERKIQFKETDITFDYEARNMLREKIPHPLVPIIRVGDQFIDPVHLWFEKLENIFQDSSKKSTTRR